MTYFDVGSAVNAAGEWVRGAPIVRAIAASPIYVALLLTAIVAVVMIATFRGAVTGAGSKKIARALIYAFVGITAVILIHHGAVEDAARRSAGREGVRDVFAGIEMSRAMGAPGSVPVFPGSAATGGRSDNVDIVDTDPISFDDVSVIHAGPELR